MRNVSALLVSLALGVPNTTLAQGADAGAFRDRSTTDGASSPPDGRAGADAEAEAVGTTYVASVTSKSRKRVFWQRSECVLIRPNAAGAPNIDDGSDIEAIERAVSRWHEATGHCSYLRLVLQEPTIDAVPAYLTRGQNENVIYWVNDRWEHDARAAGITTVFFIDDPERPDDGRILDADIEINGRFTFSSAGEPGKTDIENTVVHELGHLMGLDHTCDDGARNPVPSDNLGRTIPACAPVKQLAESLTEATMYNNAAVGETKKRTPEAGDVLGICEAYPLDQTPGRCAPVEPQGESSGCSVGVATPGKRAPRVGARPGAWAGRSLGPVYLILLVALLILGRRQRRRPE